MANTLKVTIELTIDPEAGVSSHGKKKHFAEIEKTMAETENFYQETKKLIVDIVDSLDESPFNNEEMELIQKMRFNNFQATLEYRGSPQIYVPPPSNH